MKAKAKYCAAIASVFAFAAFAQAQEDTVSNVYGGTTSRVQLVSEEGKPDLVLNPNQGDPTAEARFAAEESEQGKPVAPLKRLRDWQAFEIQSTKFRKFVEKSFLLLHNPFASC